MSDKIDNMQLAESIRQKVLGQFANKCVTGA